MNKEEALGDFFQSLHVAINNGFAYVKDHPYFLKSVEEFKVKLDQLFLYLSPVKIVVNPASLFVDERLWEKVRLYAELAQAFHLRKIKSVEFRPGASAQELTLFFSKLSLPTKEILKAGGFNNILDDQVKPRILIEDLDYSDLLRYTEEELSDVWIFLLKEAAEKGGAAKVREVVENFGRILERFKLKDFIENEELRRALSGFLGFLKSGFKEEFSRCIRSLFGFFSRQRDIPDTDFAALGYLFQGLQEDDFALLLWKEISEDVNFNLRALRLFSRLAGEEKAEKISFSLKGLAGARTLKDNTRLIGRAKGLLSIFADAAVPAPYRAALEGLLQDLSAFDLPFEQGALELNYRFALLNLFEQEADPQKLEMISEPLARECNQVIAGKNFVYLKDVLGILYRKIKLESEVEDIFSGMERRLTNFIEGAAFKEDPDPILEQLFGSLRKSFLGLDFYLDMIFNQKKFNSCVLKLFMRFFPADLPLFYERLEARHAQIEFLAKIVEDLIAGDCGFSMPVVKHIFNFSGEVIKIEILKSMQKLKYCDEELVFSVLEKGDLPLKREAAACLADNPGLRKKAAEILLSLSSPWGKYNNLIMENLLLAEELSLREADESLAALAKRRFFWNRRVRARALSILKGWNVRKD